VADRSRYYARIERDLLTVSGPEAGSFLQGQLSQDVALAVGTSTWSWLLAPNGKVDALLRVTRRSEAEWLLDTDAGWGSAVEVRLRRFKLRTKVELVPATVTMTVLRGPGWEALLSPMDGAQVVVPAWPGVAGSDLLHLGGGPGPAFDEPLLAGDEYESRRILAGIPKMGAELDERTIPAETGLVAITVSFSKGCYTGQELVARIDSRGSNVARRLRSLRFSERVSAGAALVEPEGREVGVVTSAALSEDEGWVGLGYVRRGVEPGSLLTAGPGGPAVTAMSELPAVDPAP
jgi:folate-binding protein YgfZ